MEKIDGSGAALSIYAGDEPMTPVQATAEVTKVAEMFNIDAAKADLMLEIIIEKGWSYRKFKDAIKHVIETNIYNTTDKGIEPGKILSYDRQIKLLNQEDVLKANGGNGTHGYVLIWTPFKHKIAGGKVTNYWYVSESDYLKYGTLINQWRKQKEGDQNDV